MFNLKDVNILKFIAAFSLTIFLAACSSSDGISFDPNVAPQNVQVVSGDGFDSDVQNTISWTLVPAATNYAVYFGNTPDVTENSSNIVTTTAVNHVTHSGLGVVEEGTALYYRVQALSGVQSSILSDEVTGTPQLSITNNALNDVAWNGTDTLVAVGDAGVIINSPNGMADGWTDVPASGLSVSLKGVTWENDTPQFLIVGAGLTVLTWDGSIGTTWNKEDLDNLPITATTDLEDVTWLGTGSGYIAVGQNGTIITSPNGSDWDLRTSPSSNTLNGVASNDNLIVVAVGTNGTILTSGDGGANWTAQTNGNNSLNDITWDGNQFGVVGSNDTILTSTDGETWTSHNPGTSSIAFIAASQWDYLLPIDPTLNPVLGAVGSSGTFVVSPDAVTTRLIIPTGTDTGLLSGITWVDDGVTSPYFVMVGNDGTVLTSQLQ